MSYALARKRGFIAIWLVLASAALGATSWIVTQPPAGLAVPAGGLPAAPALANGEAQARKISIASREGSLTVVRTQRGWVLAERGDYPVSPERTAALQKSLAGLRFKRPMTHDPAKLDRLSLGDPAMGGKGVVVQIEDARAAPLVDLVLGFEDRGIYGRERSSSQAWAIAGDLEPLSSPAVWISAPSSLRGEDFVRLDVAPAIGPAYTMLRDEQGALALGRPYSYRKIIEPSLAKGVLEAFRKPSPIDVQPAPAIEGAVIARVAASTIDGLRADAELIRDGQGVWIKVSAPRPGEGASDDLMRRVQEINAELAPWAFKLGKGAVEALTPPLTALTGLDAQALAPPRPVAPSTSPASAAAPAPAPSPSAQ